jgi:hypothetical protein
MKEGTYFGDGYIAKFDDGSNIIALVTSVKGKPVGPLMTFHGDNRTIAAAMVYDSQAQRTGPMLIFSDKDMPKLFAQWRKDQRDGWFVLFDGDGRAELAARYAHDKMAEAYRVSKGTVAEKLDDNGQPAFGSQLAGTIARLNYAIEDIKQNEKAFKKALASWDESTRRAAVADQAAAKRQDIIARGRADNSGLIKALGGMGSARTAPQTYYGPVLPYK